MTCDEARATYERAEQADRDGTGPWLHTIIWSYDMEAHRYHGCWFGEALSRIPTPTPRRDRMLRSGGITFELALAVLVMWIALAISHAH